MDFVRAETLSGQKELKAEMAMSRSENRAGSEDGFVLGS